MSVTLLPNIFIQAVGFAALAMALLMYQFNKRSSILRTQVTACLLYVVHFLLLGAYTGAALNLISATRNVFYDKYSLGKKRQRAIPIAFIILFIIFGLITWRGPQSVLPVVASCLGAIALWQKNPKSIRLILLFTHPLWFTYDLIVGSTAGMFAETFLLLSTLLGIYRYDLPGHIAIKITRKQLKSFKI